MQQYCETNEAEIILNFYSDEKKWNTRILSVCRKLQKW